MKRFFKVLILSLAVLFLIPNLVHSQEPAPVCVFTPGPVLSEEVSACLLNMMEAVNTAKSHADIVFTKMQANFVQGDPTATPPVPDTPAHLNLANLSDGTTDHIIQISGACGFAYASVEALNNKLIAVSIMRYLKFPQ